MRSKQTKRAPRYPYGSAYFTGAASLLDSDFESVWAPPLTLKTDATDSPDKLGESWRARKESSR